MKPLALDLRGAKKIAGDKHSSTFHLKSGHQMKFVHASLPPLQRKQMEKMPLHLAEGDPGVGAEDDAESATPGRRFDANIKPLGANADKYKAQIAQFDIPQGQKDVDAPPVPADAAPASDNDALQQWQNGLEPENVKGPSPASISPDSAVPAQPESASNPGGVDVQGAYDQGQRAITENQNVATQNANANAAALQNDLDARKQLNDSFQQNLADIQTHQKQYIQDYAAGHIDPKHYQESMGGGTKAATAIGLLLGGISSARTGGANPAMQFLSQQIDRDIAAQQANLDKKKTLLGANQDLYKDAILGHQATRLNMNEMLDHQIQLQAAKTGSQAAQAAADQAHSKFALENASLLQNMAMRKTALEQLNNPNSGADPAALVRYLVPEPHQKAVFDEIDRAKDTRNMSGAILTAFDQAAKDNTVLKTGGGYLRTPPTVGALHQAMQPTFKDLEGTVRQAAMDNTFKNITPAPGDLPSSIKTKREALVDYLNSKASAATAKGFGIDLNKFSSTRPPQQPPQTKTVNGITYQRGPNGEAIPVK